MEGKVKKKQYLDYLVRVRYEEQRARDIGMRIAWKSIAEIRKEFEEQYGSIYVEM